MFGDPTPEVVWYKNEKKIERDNHFSMTLEQGKYANLTINGVTTEDSGKYGINVRNKCGGETVDVTVSVYKYEEDVPAPKPGQMPKPAAHPAQSRQQSNLSPPKQEGKLGSK